MPPSSELAIPDLPAAVHAVMAALADAGHEAALVGGSVRDRLLGQPHPGDWDVATAARPEEVAALFPGATWENRFGTVTVGRDPAVEVTSYRTEGGYRDRRRPDEVRFGVSLADDLARRDFTINAVAWVPEDLAAGRGRVVDLHGGAADLQARVLRTVGDPRDRFGEDALRLIRAIRFASRFDLRLDPATEAAIVELAPSVASVSGERVRDELARILRLDRAPSRALALLGRAGLLEVILPELEALRGIPQDKAVPGDALDHTLAAVDAAPVDDDGIVRWTALLHDLGKATTLADGHFIGHESVGAELARAVMERLRLPRGRIERIARRRRAVTCTTTSPAGPMPQSGASSVAPTKSIGTCCSRFGAPTMPPPARAAPGRRTRTSWSDASRQPSRRSRSCSDTDGSPWTATTSRSSWGWFPAPRSAASSGASPIARSTTRR